MLDRKREGNRASLDSRRTDKGNRTLDRLVEEHFLASGVENKSCAHLEPKAGKSLGEAADVLNYLSVLNALRKCERAIVLIYNEIVFKGRKSRDALSVIRRRSDGDGFGTVYLLGVNIRKNNIFL